MDIIEWLSGASNEDVVEYILFLEKENTKLNEIIVDLYEIIADNDYSDKDTKHIGDI